MYWCAKSPGRVIEKAWNFSAFYALLPLILLFSIHSVQNISEYQPGVEVGLDGDTHVPARAAARSALALPDYSFAPDDASAEVVVSSGAHVLTADDESFEVVKLQCTGFAIPGYGFPAQGNARTIDQNSLLPMRVISHGTAFG